MKNKRGIDPVILSPFFNPHLWIHLLTSEGEEGREKKKIIDTRSMCERDTPYVPQQGLEPIILLSYGMMLQPMELPGLGYPVILLSSECFQSTVIHLILVLYIKRDLEKMYKEADSI